MRSAGECPSEEAEALALLQCSRLSVFIISSWLSCASALPACHPRPRALTVALCRVSAQQLLFLTPTSQPRTKPGAYLR